MQDLADRLRRARAGDGRALEELIRAYQQPVARFVAGQIGDRHSTEDVCQTVFVKMVLSMPRLRSTEAFEPWLFRIAENACRDFQRRERWRRRFLVSLEKQHDSAEMNGGVLAGHVETDLEVAQLHLGLAQMRQRQRQLLALAMDRPRSYEELASLTHLSVSALKSRLFRARARLRRLLRHVETNDET